MIDWSLRAAAVILLGALLTLALRRRSAATRNLAVRLTLAMAIALPLVALVAPRVAVPVPAPTPVVAVDPSAPVRTLPTPVSTSAPQEGLDLAAFPTVVDRQPTRSSSFHTAVFVLPIYLLGVAILALRWLAGLARLRRLTRNSTPVDGEPSVRRAAITVPATYAGTILLPLESSDWPEARVRAAILHERAHVRRRDWTWQTLAGLFATAHWPNPAVWLLACALRDTAELAADDAALAEMRPSDYARELLAVAANGGSTGPAMAMARRGGMVDRVTAILTQGLERCAPSRRFGLIAGGLLLLVAFGIAGIGKKTAQEPPFSKTLLDGQTAHVALVIDLMAKQAWTPDGKPAPFPTSMASEDAGHVSKVRSVRLVGVDVAGTTSERPTVSFYTPYIAGEELVKKRATRVDPDGRPVTRHWFPLRTPAGATEVDGQLQLSVGPWKDERPLERGKAPGQASLPRAAPVRGPDEFVFFVTAHIQLTRRDVRYALVPLDRDDRPLPILDCEGVGSRLGGEAGFIVRARLGDRSIARWLLRSRPIESVEFKGIRLQPDGRKGSPTQIVPQEDAPLGDVRRLRSSGTIRLVDIREGDQAWQPDGTLLPHRTERDGFIPSRGKRAVTFKFERTGREAPNLPGILARDFLHQTGKPILLNDVFDEFEMLAPNPRYASSANGGGGREQGPNGTYTSHPTFTRELSPSLTWTSVRVRVSSGPVTLSSAPARILKTERLTRSSQINGKWYPGVRLTVLVPKELRKETVLLRAFDSKGLMIEGSSPVAPFADGTTSVTYDTADPKQIARLQWAHRTPEFVDFDGVHLWPNP